MKTLNSSLSSYKLFDKYKQIPLNNQIIISILYSHQDIDHRDGQFYVGQLLYHILKNYHSRFIVTLCKNNNKNNKLSDDIDLIRHLIPVFIINKIYPDQIIYMYEQEQQAHLQCILTNFQSFSNINYSL